MAKEILNFACVYWEGNFRGRDYCANDVVRLNYALKKLHPSDEINLFCLTNSIDDKPMESCGIKVIPLLFPSDLPGWWAKLELLRPNIFPKFKRILYTDLDVTPIKDLTMLFEYKSISALCFMPSMSNVKSAKTINRFQSSIFAFTADRLTFSMESIIKSNVVKYFRGDQDYFGKYFANMPTFPGEWFEKLATCFKNSPRKDTKAILGNPKTIWRKAQKDVKWIREVYE
jgi:hypothetical protein